MWIILCIILSILLVSLLITFYIFFRRTENKFEIYSTFISETYNSIIRAHTIMKRVDIRGAFESDDEVGEVYKIIKFEIDRLKNLVESGIESENAENTTN